MWSFSSARKLHSQKIKKKEEDKKKNSLKFVQYRNWLETPSKLQQRQQRIDGTPTTSNKTGSRFLIDKVHNCLPAIIYNKQDKEN